MTPILTRRILTFPAIHPCNSISATTLLHALISISHAISDLRSKCFPVHRRSAREAIREVRILVFFLEEIRDQRCGISESVMLCLSELYVALQKVRYLLEDCSREGARAWMLMRLDWVTNEFRILIRTVATTLDVLPLRSVAVAVEVREWVSLVTEQARKVSIQTDAGDERTAKEVLSILTVFGSRVVPDLSRVRSVLDHLEIRSWNECDKEIKFLEEEIEFENSKGDERNMTLLSSLLGLMNYCRAVLFDDFGPCGNERSCCRLDGAGALSCLNPEDFRCPISLELMKDPVTICTGQTYDRASIQKWLKAGNLICPKTGEKLVNTDLFPNLLLHKLIQLFCLENGITISETSNRSRDLGRTISAGSLSANGSMRMLAIFLVEKLSEGTPREVNKAAYEIRLLSKSNIFNRATLVEAGAALALLFLISSAHPSIQENAMAALLNLSKYCKGKTVIFEFGGLTSIVDVLRSGLKMEARQSAAATLFYLSSVDEYREAIGEVPEAIPALVELLKSGSSRSRKNAVVALFGLLLVQGNHQRALAAGIIPPLINIVASGRGDLVIDSLAALAALAENPDGAHAVFRASAIPPIVEILHSTTSRAGKEYCVSVLLSLCNTCGAAAVSVLQKAPSLMGSLYMVLIEGTSRASKRASSLLRLLHDHHNPGSSGLLSPAIKEDNAVHVR